MRGVSSLLSFLHDKLEAGIDRSLGLPGENEDKKPFQYIGKIERSSIYLLNKISDESVIYRIKQISKAIFFGGSFSLIGVCFIALAIVKPEILSIVTLILPLLFLSATIQMIFWIVIGCCSIVFGAGIFLGEVKGTQG